MTRVRRNIAAFLAVRLAVSVTLRDCLLGFAVISSYLQVAEELARGEVVALGLRPGLFDLLLLVSGLDDPRHEALGNALDGLHPAHFLQLDLQVRVYRVFALEPLGVLLVALVVLAQILCVSPLGSYHNLLRGRLVLVQLLWRRRRGLRLGKRHDLFQLERGHLCGYLPMFVTPQNLDLVVDEAWSKVEVGELVKLVHQLLQQQRHLVLHLLLLRIPRVVEHIDLVLLLIQLRQALLALLVVEHFDVLALQLLLLGLPLGNSQTYGVVEEFVADPLLDHLLEVGYVLFLHRL